MQFFTTLLFAVAASAAALNARAPVTRSARLVLRGSESSLCPGIDSPVCCETDVDGIADLTCDPPATVPKGTADFIKVCAKAGLTAECCTLDVDGVGLVCTKQSA